MRVMRQTASISLLTPIFVGRPASLAIVSFVRGVSVYLVTFTLSKKLQPENEHSVVNGVRAKEGQGSGEINERW
jgi:hypothetical protein